jgi:poly(hydroxyalkanoate) granule-associated protein
MLKKARAEQKEQDARSGVTDLGQGILESSRQIWLAGLGAFARAQQEGMKMFETLVAQGENLESRTRQAASQTAAAARGAATAKAREVQAMAGGTWDKLEQVFEDRVARALSKLGVYTQNDVQRLAERVDALSERVNELINASGAGARKRSPAGHAKAAKGKAKAKNVDPGAAQATGRKGRKKAGADAS